MTSRNPTVVGSVTSHVCSILTGLSHLLSSRYLSVTVFKGL